ncbi:MAG: hypothetical protein R2771_09200 [Saprospiraceae bacterium]
MTENTMETYCHKKNKMLVRIYDKLKDYKFTKGNGFTIFGVSLDKNKDKWIKAIKDDKLNWPYHVSDLSNCQ